MKLNRRTSTWVIIAAALVTELSGCATNSQSSTPVHVMAHRNTQHKIQPSSVAREKPITVSSLTSHSHRIFPIPPATTLNESMIRIQGMWYQAPKNAHSSFQYIDTPSGIIWAIIPSLMGRSKGMAPAHQRQVTLYEATPIKTTDAKHPFALAPISRVLVKLPLSLTAHLVTSSMKLYTLIQGSLIFSMASSGHKNLTDYFGISSSAVGPKLLFTSNEDVHHTFVYAANDNIIFASVQSTPLGPVPQHLEYAQVKSTMAQTVPISIPFNSWPITVLGSDQPQGNVHILSGGKDITLAEGLFKISSAPALPLSASWFARKQPTSTSYLPSVMLPAVLGSPVTLNMSKSGKHSYQVDVITHGQRTLSVNIVQRSPSTAKTQRNIQDRNDALISHFFGTVNMIHSFTLDSQEGPTVSWHQCTLKGKQVSWFTTFRAKHWEYMVGPFDTPADARLTSLLSVLLTHSVNTAPATPSDHGIVMIMISAQTATYEKTEIIFNPQSTLHVQLSGRGVQPLSDVAAWV